jgi:hypothetical protein
LYGLCCTLLWVLSTALFARELFQRQRLLLWVTLLLVLLTEASLALFARFRFSQKLGQTLPLLGVAFPVFAFLALQRLSPHRATEVSLAVATWRGKLAASVVLGLISAAMVWSTIRWVKKKRHSSAARMTCRSPKPRRARIHGPSRIEPWPGMLDYCRLDHSRCPGLDRSGEPTLQFGFREPGAAAAVSYLPAHRPEARHALVRWAVLARTSTGMA